MDEMSTQEMLDFLSRPTPEAGMSRSTVDSKWERIAAAFSQPPRNVTMDMARGESKSVTMTIGDKSFPVKDIVWKEFVPPSPKAGSAEVKVAVARDLRWDFLSDPLVPSPFDKSLTPPTPRWGKSFFVEQMMNTWRKAMNDPAEFIKTYFDSMKEEENVNYLFRVYVIDLKEKALLGNIPVVCSDVSKATAIATMRLELSEDTLEHFKFHVDKICTVPEWDGA